MNDLSISNRRKIMGILLIVPTVASIYYLLTSGAYVPRPSYTEVLGWGYFVFLLLAAFAMAGDHRKIPFNGLALLDWVLIGLSSWLDPLVKESLPVTEATALMSIQLLFAFPPALLALDFWLFWLQARK